MKRFSDATYFEGHYVYNADVCPMVYPIVTHCNNGVHHGVRVLLL